MTVKAEAVSTSALRASFDVRVVIRRLRRRLMAVSDASDITPAQASVLTRIGRGEAVTGIALARAEGVRP